MTSLPAAVAASIATFAATNIDDFFLLTLFFARRVETRTIVAGQYFGFGAIVLVSLLGLWAAVVVPAGWIRFLGIIPIALGVKQMIQGHKATVRNENRSSPLGVLSIASLTLANGADNVGVYLPFFAVSRAYLWAILTVYAFLVGVWCYAGRWFGNHDAVLRTLDRYGHKSVPLVFVALGLYILAGS